MDLILDQFEGPLDLLLHLIKTSKIDIYDIPILELTEQYITYLKQMEELNLDIASEFIVMASELLFIKSKMLLPIEVVESEEEGIDPRKELMEKLLDYQRYKELSIFLKEREPLGSFSFTKPKEKIKGLIKHTKLSIDKEELKFSILEMLKRIEAQLPPPRSSFSGIIEREVISVEFMSSKLESTIVSYENIELTQAFLKICKTKAQVCATFLGLLDLAKLNKILIIYENNKYMLRAVIKCQS